MVRKGGTREGYPTDPGDGRDADCLVLNPNRGGAGREYAGSARVNGGSDEPRTWPLAKGADGPNDSGGGTTSAAAAKPRRSGPLFGEEAVNG